MPLTAGQLEEIAAWCGMNPDLEAQRRQARPVFFDEDDPRPTRYWGGTGDSNSRLRRFLGWFMFAHELPGGERPAVQAAEALYRGSAKEEALRAVSGARYLLAIVTTVLSGRSVYLELEDERFEVRDRRWTRILRSGVAVCTYLVPTGRLGQWLPGPGWLEWPTRIGPNMRPSLRQFQPDPISVERLLQAREEPEDERRPAPPQDATLEQAVARMTAAAQEAGRTGLVMSVPEWEALVVSHLKQPNMTAFIDEIVKRIGAADSMDDLNGWLQLAMNIWNTTPQPDRGGKSAYELSGRWRRS